MTSVEQKVKIANGRMKTKKMASRLRAAGVGLWVWKQRAECLCHSWMVALLITKSHRSPQMSAAFVGDLKVLALKGCFMAMYRSMEMNEMM